MRIYLNLGFNDSGIRIIEYHTRYVNARDGVTLLIVQSFKELIKI